MRADLHTLTGAYAANALFDDEQTLFEEHLEACEACRREVTELQAAAACLAALVEQGPPAGLRDRVLREIDRTRQEPPGRWRLGSAADVADDATAGAAPGRPRGAPHPGAPWEAGDRTDEHPPEGLATRRMTRPWWGGLLAPAAAVVVVLLVSVALVVSGLTDRVDELEAASGEAIEVMAAPDAETVTVEGPDGSFARVVMSASRGEAVFLVDGMEPAPHEHTYELWLIHDEVAVPAGLFDVDGSGRVTRLLSGDMETASAIGVTVEPEGGSPEPTTEPVMLIDLDDA